METWAGRSGQTVKRGASKDCRRQQDVPLEKHMFNCAGALCAFVKDAITFKPRAAW